MPITLVSSWDGGMIVSQEGGRCLHLAAARSNFFSVNFCLLKGQSCDKRWKEGNSIDFSFRDTLTKAHP